MITQDRLKELLAYDQATGEFRWAFGRPKASKGALAGARNDRGYVVVKLDGRTYRAHRLAWLYVNGTWPTEIDHINRCRSDNRLENLREATRQQNCENRGIMANNTSGVNGVHWNKAKRKWTAYVRSNRRKTHLGTFSCIEDASAAIEAAKQMRASA